MVRHGEQQGAQVAAQLELRHLRYFLAVAEELNFSRAAERLHIAQPALSAQIRTLETQLGCELFTRTTRKVELTPAGELLLPDARELVRQADQAAAKVAAVARGQRGQLRIGFVAHAGGEIGNEVLRRFGVEFPAIEAELVESRTLEGVQLRVAEHDTDAAFVWHPILHDELENVVIAAEPKLVAMHPEHRLASQTEIRPNDLLDEPIVAPWHRYTEATLVAWLAPFRKHRNEGDPYAESIDECLNFVMRRLAVFCVPASVERFYSRPDVVFRPLVDVTPAQISLVWHRESGNPALESFVGVTNSVLQEQATSIQSGKL